jgi:hypothetical protein
MLCNVRSDVDYHLSEIKKLIWTEFHNYPSASYGIGYDKESDLAYEIYKCILHQFEKDDMKECELTDQQYHSNVHTGTPLKQTDIPFIQIETIDPRETKLERILNEDGKV